MDYKNLKITAATSGIRLIGRMDPEQDSPALDWTGSGIEFRFRGSDVWAELEAPARSPIMWMIALADGRPITRFPVEPGIRFYPLLLGMEADKVRTVTLMKETQCMSDNPEATVLLRSLRMAGKLEELPVRDLRIEFIGDSLTSGEGALAVRNNEEWVTPWFTARGNYSWYACEALNAERSILSQSGGGVCWDWQHDPKNNMTDTYESTVGVLHGPEAEARGCTKPWDFASHPADIVCIRLLTNDIAGIGGEENLERDREKVLQGCMKLIRKVRKFNPGAKIVWIRPGREFHPELASEAISLLTAEGMRSLFTYTLPEYEEKDYGARAHPSAEWNRMAGELLAEFLKRLQETYCCGKMS